MLLKAELKELEELTQDLDDNSSKLKPAEESFHDTLLQQLELGSDGHVTPKQWTWARQIRQRVTSEEMTWG